MFGWRGKKVSEHDWICSLSTEERNKEYVKTARERWESCWMIQGSDGWTVASGKDDIVGCVSVRQFKEFGKIHRIKGVVDAHWSSVFEQLVHGDNESPAWNPTVMECRTVEKIDDNIDIVYNIAREAAGGLVSRRDFVNLRHWKKQDGIMVSLGWSVPHPDMPPNKKHVRAENRPSFWTFEEDEEDPSKCHFALYTRIDLRGWLPHYLVEQAMVNVLSNYLVYLRNRMEHLKGNSPQQGLALNGVAHDEKSSERVPADKSSDGNSPNSPKYITSNGVIPPVGDGDGKLSGSTDCKSSTVGKTENGAIVNGSMVNGAMVNGAMDSLIADLNTVKLSTECSS